MRRIVWRLAVFDPFPIVSIAYPLLGAPVPQVAAGRHRVAIEGTLPRKMDILLHAAIVEGPGFFNEIGRVGGHRPFMAVGRDFAVGVEIVQEDELSSQLMMVGSDLLGKQA